MLSPEPSWGHHCSGFFETSTSLFKVQDRRVPKSRRPLMYQRGSEVSSSSPRTRLEKEKIVRQEGPVPPPWENTKSLKKKRMLLSLPEVIPSIPPTFGDLGHKREFPCSFRRSLGQAGPGGYNPRKLPG
jgi:hypothetical protein